MFQVLHTLLSLTKFKTVSDLKILEITKTTGPVSTLACKKLGNCPSILKSKKLNKLKSQQFFFDPKEKKGHRANCCSQNVRNQPANIGKHNLTEQKPSWEPVLGKPEL